MEGIFSLIKILTLIQGKSVFIQFFHGCMRVSRFKPVNETRVLVKGVSHTMEYLQEKETQTISKSHNKKRDKDYSDNPNFQLNGYLEYFPSEIQGILESHDPVWDIHDESLKNITTGVNANINLGNLSSKMVKRRNNNRK